MLEFMEQIFMEPIEERTPLISQDPIARLRDAEIGVDFGAMTSWKSDALSLWRVDAMREHGIEMRMGELMPCSENIIGTPNAYEVFYDPQDLPYNCGVAVQYCILRAFGVDVTEAELTELAMEKGWLTHNGTSPADMGKVLEHFGVETHSYSDATFADLIDELERGRAVIISVDAGELWADSVSEHAQEWLEDHILGISDHVVWITGIDLSDPDNPQIIINDTGHPDGAGARYPYAEFKDAWEDGRYTYFVTDEAPPAYKDYQAQESRCSKNG